MNNQFLNQKRNLEEEEEIPNENNKKLKTEENVINVKELIDEAFECFLKGENEKFIKNLEILEDNKYSKFNFNK